MLLRAVTPPGSRVLHLTHSARAVEKGAPHVRCAVCGVRCVLCAVLCAVCSVLCTDPLLRRQHSRSGAFETHRPSDGCAVCCAVCCVLCAVCCVLCAVLCSVLCTDRPSDGLGQLQEERFALAGQLHLDDEGRHEQRAGDELEGAAHPEVIRAVWCSWRRNAPQSEVIRAIFVRGQSVSWGPPRTSIRFQMSPR